MPAGKSPPAAGAAGGRRTVPGAARPARSSAIPTDHDLAQAREDALLQLKIGRTAHYYTLILFTAFLADGFLIVLLNPFGPNLPLFRTLAFLLFPVAGALLLSAFGIWVKWETYQIWPWEAHFWVTVVSLPVSITLAYIYFARVAGFGPTGTWNLVPGFLPVALLGITLPILGLEMTWQEWTRRKIGAFLAAGLPIPIALTLYIPASESNLSALTLTLIASGGLYLAAGSLLHLVSSGTQAHEREIIVSGQARLFQYSEDLRQREDGLRSREGGLLRREADVEVAEAAIARKLLAIEDTQSQLKTLEQDLDGRATKVHSDFQQAALKLAEASQLRRELSDRESQLGLREEALKRGDAQRQEREKALAQSEGELIRRQLEHTNREKELHSRVQALPTLEARLDARQKELDRKAADLATREGRAPLPRAAAALPAAAGKDSSLAEREAKLAQVQQTVNEQNALLGRKSREVEARLTDARQMLEEQARREQALVARERELGQRETNVAHQAEEATARQQQYEVALKRLEDRARLFDRRQTELAGQTDDVGQRLKTLEAREASLRQGQEVLARQQEEVDRLQRDLLTRQKEYEAQAARATFAPLPPTESARPVLLPGASASKSARPGAPRPGRVSTGLPRLDDLLFGGIPEGGHILLVGPPFIGREVLLYSFLIEGLRQGEHAVLLTTNRSPAELGQELAEVSPLFREKEQAGQVHWIDASNPTAAPSLEVKDGATRAVVKGPADFAGILAALASAVKGGSGPGKARSFRAGVLNLSTCLAQGEAKATLGFVHNFVGILKARKAPAMYGIDPSALDDTQLEATLARMDGALRFQQDRGKTLLSVQGLGEVATREWVEYRASNRTLSLGSFALERIR